MRVFIIKNKGFHYMCSIPLAIHHHCLQTFFDMIYLVCVTRCNFQLLQDVAWLPLRFTSSEYIWMNVIKLQHISTINTIMFSVYTDASSNCNDLSFQLGSTGIGTTLPGSRSWQIKVISLHLKFQTFDRSRVGH